jgi:hypothetical protein
MPRQSFTISGHLAVAVNRKFKPLRVLLKRESPKMPLRKIALLAAPLHHLGSADLECSEPLRALRQDSSEPEPERFRTGPLVFRWWQIDSSRVCLLLLFGSSGLVCTCLLRPWP